MKRTKLSAWLLTVVVFLISLGVIYWVGVPLGNPDANVLLAVEVVLAAAFAMFVNAIAYPQSRIGDQTGLGAPSVSFTVAVVTLAIAGLAAAFVGLRHPMVAAWLAGIAAVAIVFRTLLTRFLTRLYWGAPIKNRPSVYTIWKVGLAEVAGKEMNEPFQERLSEVQALCASQPKVTAETSQKTAELDEEITRAVRELQGFVSEGELGKATASLDTIRDGLRRRIEILGSGKAPHKDV